MTIKDDFLEITKMVDLSGNKTGVEQVMDYLLSPEVVDKMIIASEMELPVLTLIAKGLEETFDENSNFPVVVTPTNNNATFRQNIGRMIKFIMNEYGYTPIDGNLSERSRIPAISGSKHFSTSAVYKKTCPAKYKITQKSEKI